jgi:hypothetical protein
MAHRRDHDRALKRGRGRPAVPSDLLDAEGRYGREPAHELTAERLYERRWAFELLGRVLVRLEAEAGNAELFRYLKSMLEGDELAAPYRELLVAFRFAKGLLQ